jgi:tripartite-type tricarboxylate transporter receptor subunit TctC
VTDFAPVALMVEAPLVLVARKELPVRAGLSRQIRAKRDRQMVGADQGRRHQRRLTSFVMPGLVPGIHVFASTR